MHTIHNAHYKGVNKYYFQFPNKHTKKKKKQRKAKRKIEENTR